MKLALYVHDLKLEIGHSNSLIELIRHLPPSYAGQIERLELISFTIGDPMVMFPALKGKVHFVRVPFGWIRPVLLKSIFFQLWTYFYNLFFQVSGTFKIGIGISSLSVDAVSVQFIHHQWTKRGLEMEEGHGIRKFYKKVLFSYFEACERHLFSKPGLKVFSPAMFLSEFLKDKFPKLDSATIYSGVNLSRFELGSVPREEVLSSLLASYPVLRDLDLSKPIYLFVGAYERKGLPRALELLEHKPSAQFIVIGSPSLGKRMNWPPHLKVFPITFTKQIPLFYALSDVFLFPTIYEPFGLVLFEAMSMGLSIVTRLEEVGASELLGDLPEVYFCDKENFLLPDFESKSIEDKSKLRSERLKKLGDVSWYQAGEKLSHFLGPIT